jgi:aminoglycoside/choline kinase family phosphotransferase
MDLNILKELYSKHFKTECTRTEQLVPAGSARQYYRLSDGSSTAVGAFNEDVRENRAFISFTRHFISSGLPVPDIYLVAEDEKHYLIEDLGDTNLKDLSDSMRKEWEFPVSLVSLYKRVIDQLIRFQTEGHSGLDYTVCIPRDSFDSRSVMWDLNHFKYFFLKLSGIPFNEDKLEDDFKKIASIIEKVPRNSFLFRDFQSRNIMIRNNDLFFIDYQGGRKGALQYDIATLLFEARVNMDDNSRQELLDHYLKGISVVIKDFNRDEFLSSFLIFALVRQLQAMGAYGLRGWIEKKPLFLQSVPFAMKNLKYFIENDSRNLMQMPELSRLMDLMVKSEKLNTPVPSPAPGLCVRINSFSYRKNIPDDLTGEGGGFVFDCRSIHNPGRYPEYFNLTGRDKEVEKFFKERSDMDSFLKDVFSIIDRTVENYTERGFRNLQVNFGCTGGQHRSVYAAEKLARHLEHNRLINVLLEHRELQDHKPENE